MKVVTKLAICNLYISNIIIIIMVQFLLSLILSLLFTLLLSLWILLMSTLMWTDIMLHRQSNYSDLLFCVWLLIEVFRKKGK